MIARTRERSYGFPRTLHCLITRLDTDEAGHEVQRHRALCAFAGDVLHGTTNPAMVTCQRCLACMVQDGIPVGADV